MEKVIRNFGNAGIDSVKSFLDISINKKYDIKDVIIISGAPRSGTTWLMEILCILPEYKSIFEPLNSHWFPEIKKIKQYSRYYLDPSQKCEELESYFKRVFTGKARNVRAHYKLNYKNLKQRIFSKKILVKFIRANRLLPWISNNFNVRETFLITRHPCAVLSSQIKTGITGYYYLTETNLLPTSEVILKEIEDYNFNDESILKKISGVNDKVGLLALAWSLDHYIPLKTMKNDWNIIKYEELLFDYEKTVTNIFTKIGETNLIEKIVSLEGTPSLTSFKGSLKNSDVQHLKWKKTITKKDVSRIEQILNWFNIEFDDENYFF